MTEEVSVAGGLNGFLLFYFQKKLTKKSKLRAKTTVVSPETKVRYLVNIFIWRLDLFTNGGGQRVKGPFTLDDNDAFLSFLAVVMCKQYHW